MDLDAYSPSDDQPTRSDLIHDPRTPDHRTGKTRCPQGCAVFFHYTGSVAYTRHMTTVHPDAS